ncbi:MAG: transcription antitermination factor NusB, partial [Candidatus Margulisbacteria bacterium]|nr:transcription antitermination factor NusB [Candidatus Margulisiibacteriota bacterium]
MGKRSTARRLAMQALYQAEIAGEDIKTALQNISENEKFIAETLGFASSLAQAAWDSRLEIDGIIEKLAIDWPLDRIGKVDRSILRLAIQELKSKETPASVIINEAVGLAKKYSGD